MDPGDVTFTFGWPEIGMLVFVLLLIYGLGGLKSYLGGQPRPHMRRGRVEDGRDGRSGDPDADDGSDDADEESDDADEESGDADGESLDDEEPSEAPETMGDDEESA